MLFDVNDYLDKFSGPGSPEPENFFSRRRAAWHGCNKAEARCDLAADRHSLFTRGVMAVALWRRSKYGRTLSELKADPEMIPFFADEVSKFIRKLIPGPLGNGLWAIVTPPPRRHLKGNFAQAVAAKVAAELEINFYPDVAAAKNRQRVNAVYELVALHPERNLIVFDDIYTTGSTLMSMRRLLLPLGKCLFNVVAINNG